MESLIIHPKNKKQLSILKELFKEMKIPFEGSNQLESPYNTAFEEKMQRAENDKKAGRYKTIKTEELWK